MTTSNIYIKEGVLDTDNEAEKAPVTVWHLSVLLEKTLFGHFSPAQALLFQGSTWQR